MNEDFVSFDLAKKLKEKGFRWNCFAYYMPHSNELIYNVQPYKGVTLYSFNSLRKELISSDFIDAPTISQVLKWLREEKKIFVEIVITPMGLYKPMIYDIEGFKKPYRDISPRINFNEAAIAGIEYVLDNLI